MGYACLTDPIGELTNADFLARINSDRKEPVTD
jgi:hypothetical protein